MLAGDAGSGCCSLDCNSLLAVENDYQVMWLLPQLKILAEQHYLTVLSVFKWLDVKIALSTLFHLY
jgi:RecG-like helicase